MQLGRARQLVTASGLVSGDEGATVIHLVLAFKAWVIPYLVTSALILALVGYALARTFGEFSFAVVVLVVAIVGLVGNVGVGLFQMRDLQRALERLLSTNDGVEMGTRPA